MYGHHDDEPVHVTLVGDAGDPRGDTAPAGVVIHRVPYLHPDDVVTLPGGLRVTSVARTLVDLAECLSVTELRATFERARELGVLDIAAVRRSAARVEWRPSLAQLQAVIAEFS